jgi:hypothetical protein
MRKWITERSWLLLSLVAFTALACDLSTVTSLVPSNATATPRALTTIPTQASPTTAAVQAQPSRTNAPSSSVGIITNAVLARGTTPLTSSPLGITDTFPPDGEIHVNIAVANAPSGTALKTIWTAVNATGVPPNTEVTSRTSAAEGSRFVDSVLFSTTRFPLGSYKVDVYLNGKLDRTLNFTVKDNVAAFRTPAPSALGNCPPPPKPDYRPPLVARKLTMAEDVNPSTFEPINATRQFKPTSNFHAIVELENTPANSKIKAVWYALDTGGAEACNSRLNETEITTSGARAWFNYKPPDKYPNGIYKVEIYVNGNLNNDVDFRVQ